MSTKARTPAPGSRSARAHSIPRCPRSTDSNWRACPKLNSRNKVPIVEGAYTSSNRVFMPAERTTSTSSMLSAPAHIPPIRVASFGAGLADPDLILVSAMCTFSPRSPARPVCSASVITGTSPAHDTRLSSSNTAESAMKLCDTCTGSAFLKPVRLLCGNSNHPSSEGTFLISTHAHPVNRSVDRGLEHAGQTFGSLTDAPGQPSRWKICGLGWRTSEVRMQPEEIPDDDHELVIERVCAIDVAKASGKVCVRTPHPNRPDRRTSGVWDVSATSRAVTELAEHLIGEGIERVTVESTSDYWRIWFYLLEAAGLQVQLVNAREARNMPGRPKTDKPGSVWLAKCTERGLLRPSFVPPAEIRVLRDYTRLRTDLTRERTRHYARLEKLLEDALIKVSAVASTMTT